MSRNQNQVEISVVHPTRTESETISRVIRTRGHKGVPTEVVTISGRFYRVHRPEGNGSPSVWINRPLKLQTA